MPVETNRQEWPLLTVRWPAGPVTDASVEQHITESAEDLRREVVHCILHDSQNALGLTAAQRRRMAAHLDTHRDAIARYTAGVAIVTPSAVIRGMITAVSWISGTPCPQRTFASEAEARTWLAEVYGEKTGQPAPFR